MRPLGGGDKDFYSDRTCKDYKIDISSMPKKSIETGSKLYNWLRDHLLGMPEDRELVKSYETYLSNNFFEDRQIVLIPRIGDDVVNIKIGDNPQLAISNLGDGLQQLIILSSSIFFNKEKTFFFIEEPDIYMHPGMQRAFINLLLEHRENQYFITTHSNHLLDMTIDYPEISVFWFRKNEAGAASTFNIQCVSSPDSNLLSDLGVRSSSVFHSNATIWVEGITDRLYFRQYMTRFCKNQEKENPDRFNIISKFKEDKHYSFVEYQGSTLTHWSFNDDIDNEDVILATKLCSKGIIIADGDIMAKNRGIFYGETLKESLIALSAKEIENFIPETVLRSAVREKFLKKGGDIEKILFVEYSQSSDGIGRYLDDLLPNTEDRSIFSEDSGTMKNKIGICKKSVKYMAENDDWEIPEEINNICDRIFSHIEHLNK